MNPNDRLPVWTANFDFLLFPVQFQLDITRFLPSLEDGASAALCCSTFVLLSSKNDQISATGEAISVFSS